MSGKNDRKPVQQTLVPQQQQQQQTLGMIQPNQTISVTFDLNALINAEREREFRYEKLLEEFAKDIAILKSQIVSLENKLKQATDDLENLKPKPEMLVLGELARQYEKAVCRAIFGYNTRIFTLQGMDSRVIGKPELSTKWAEEKAKINWDEDLEITIKILKENRLPFSHPLVTADNEPITKEYIKTIAKKHITNKDPGFEQTLSDINRLLGALENHNKNTLFKN